ncbi:MAG: hypothetical protein WCG45_00710 [bacterium]
MSKKSIIIIGIVLVIAMVGVFVFFSSFKPAGNINDGTGGTNFFSTIFPFGKSTTTNTGTPTPPADVSGYIPPEIPVTQRELLNKISTMPIAGYGIFTKERFKDVVIPPPAPEVTVVEDINTGTTTEQKPVDTKTKNEKTKIIPTAPLTEYATALRYVEKATGNIYQTFADKIYELKFTTTIIPAVYDAYFGDNGSSVVMRYLKEDQNTIDSFAGTMPKEVLGGDTSSTELIGTFLPENIKDISVSPNNSSIFYLFENGNNAIGVTATPSGDKKNQIFSSPFTEWLSQWPNNRMITLTTKPSFSVPGFMYSIDPNVKKLNKILGDIKGLTTLTSPSGKLVLYNNNNLSLRIYNTDTENSVSVGIKTMPEKCVWDKNSTIIYCAVPKYLPVSNYPDSWYQGEVSFSDDIWRLNVDNGSAVDIADPNSFTNGQDIDGIKLSLDEKGDYLFFVNKKDSYLWELQLK